ncbi:MAG: glycosyltransferase family 2 protein [Actinobacteria bacterium]|nr:glycosyltransferase family 2 protein [Actinomycetota bacterium]MCL6104793.1 glycosyltransferase family 2 protein [Actinomycetota bacterium]
MKAGSTSPLGPKDPIVSIVIVTYQSRSYLQTCLNSLFLNTPDIYELILIDNLSTDGTGKWMADYVGGMQIDTVIQNSANIGFGPAVNQGSLYARGRYLCLLNPDVVVEPGWLDYLLQAINSHTLASIVFPKILSLDGNLQEAGSVLGCDGTIYSVGFERDPLADDYSFSRFVDYGSAACWLMDKNDFCDNGGFDPIFERGYYEDVDFALRIKLQGKLVLYEPRSLVRHTRGASTASYKDAVAQREANRKRFIPRWRGYLRYQPELSELAEHSRFVIHHYPHAEIAARDGCAPERILLLVDGSFSDSRAQDEVLQAVKLSLELVNLNPKLRVTVTSCSSPIPTLLALYLKTHGVEVVRVGDGTNSAVALGNWLKTRMFHYSGVVVYSSCDDETLKGFLEETQSQAFICDFSDIIDAASFLDGLGVESRLITVGTR